MSRQKRGWNCAPIHRQSKHLGVFFLRHFGAFLGWWVDVKISDLEKLVENLAHTVGAKIKAHRKAAGMSQGDLAEALECDAPLISRYERGVTLPSVLKILQLSSIFKVSPADLLPNPQSPDVSKLKRQYLRQVISAKIFSLEKNEDLEELIEMIDKKIKQGGL